MSRDRISPSLKGREREILPGSPEGPPIPAQERNGEEGLLPDLVVVIPGRPKSWQRTRGGTRRHTMKGQRIAKQRIRIAVREALPEGWSRKGRFALLVESHYAGGLEQLEQLGAEHEGAQHEGDWDNLGKLPSDALQGILWDDDRQVTDGRSLKRYGCEAELLVIVVWRVL